MKSFIASILVALAVIGGPLGVHAAPVTSPHATTQLVAETSGAAPGSTLWVAVVQILEKGWHTYWRNPGDAGAATAIGWTLPTGWRSGDISWPTPKRLPVGPIMNYGYEGKVVLPVPVQVPQTAKPGETVQLTAAVDYLVCAEVCVPGSATVSLTIPVVAGTPAAEPVFGPLIADTLAQAPKPSGLVATFEAKAPQLKLAIVGAPLAGAAAADAYFYPYDETLIDHAKPQSIDRGARGLTVTMTAGGAFAKGAAPATAAGVLTLDGKAYEVTAKPGPPPAGAGGLGAPSATAASPASGLVLAIGGAFLGGLILNLMPCVFPILSMKAAALAGHAGEPGLARAQALAFLGGVLVSFLGLAGALVAARAAGAAVGWGFQLQSPLAVALLGLVMLAAALNLSGLFEIGTSAQGLGSGLASRGDLLGSVFTGVLAVVVAAPCTAPFMGPALGFALTQSTPAALSVFLGLGLGFAAPFTLLSLTPALIRRLPKPGPWMDLFKKALAFPMYAGAAWLVWVLAQQTGPDGLARLMAAMLALAFGAWLFGLGQRRGAMGRDGGVIGLSTGAAISLAGAIALVAVGAYGPPAGATGAAKVSAGDLPSQPWSVETLATLRAAHRPVLVNFTAAWCVTCQVNERVVFNTSEVAVAFKKAGAAYLVADWTNRDGAIAKALSDQGRIGVPLYLLYGSNGGEPEVLPQLLTPALVAGALDRAAKPAA